MDTRIAVAAVADMIISPATNSVVATVSAGSGTATIDGVPIAIAFVKG